MRKDRPREPMVESSIHWADRVWADTYEPAFQLIWDATTGLEVDSGDLVGHRGEVAAEVRIIICTVRGSQLCCGACGHTDLLRRGQCCCEAIHLETSCGDRNFKSHLSASPASCSGLRTGTLRLANKDVFGPAISANKTPPGPTLFVNEPTLFC